MVSRRQDDKQGKDEGDGFLSRWAQRKQAMRDPAEAEALRREEEAAEAAPDAGTSAEADVPAIGPEDLPDVDSLNAASDFTPFMQEGVPTALRQRALRRLWQVDPAFREICMLDDYNLDYTDAATVVPNLQTLFQAGRGMVLPEEASLSEKPGEAELQPEPETVGAAGEEGGQTAPQGEPPALAGDGDAPAPAAAPPPRKPGTPLVSPSDTPPRQPASAARPAGKSARHRRWGDPDA